MSAVADAKPVVEVLKGRRQTVPPVWLMRQAGRYLPEYRALREEAGSFLKLCLTPALAAEATLQPVRRFGFDAAIVFSDILVIPLALGQELHFEAAEGPRLAPVLADGSLAALRRRIDRERLQPVYETIGRVRSALPANIALLGFCGAPWTLATYMVAGRATDDQVPARRLGYESPDAFAGLIDVLIDAAVDHLVWQFEAGADAVQIFDSWAGALAAGEFERWCVEPTRRIVEGVRARWPAARIIGFPRGAGSGLRAFAEAVGVDALGLDWTVGGHFVRTCLPSAMAVQGNVDPLALKVGGPALDTAVDRALENFAQRPFIFNLGHGIAPDTPIEHVTAMLRRIRGG